MIFFIRKRCQDLKCQKILNSVQGVRFIVITLKQRAIIVDSIFVFVLNVTTIVILMTKFVFVVAPDFKSITMLIVLHAWRNVKEVQGNVGHVVLNLKKYAKIVVPHVKLENDIAGNVTRI